MGTSEDLAHRKIESGRALPQLVDLLEYPFDLVAEPTGIGCDAPPPNSVPVLAYGANGNVEIARRKAKTCFLEPFTLHGFDVVAAACMARTGYIPATLYASPGTSVDVAVSWLPAVDLLKVDATEPNYARVQLDVTVRGEPVQVYMCLHGAWAPNGAPLAFSARRAENRKFQAVTERELMATFNDKFEAAPTYAQTRMLRAESLHGMGTNDWDVPHV